MDITYYIGIDKTTFICRQRIKGSQQKKTGKKVHNSCELSPKMENPPPPPPISQQI